MDEFSVLIVDDNEGDRYIINRHLKETKLPICKIFEEQDGESALDFFLNFEDNIQSFPNGFPPTLVFLDINMPLLDGHGFLKKFSELRERKEYKSIVIMMFSSSERDEDKEHAMGYHFVKEYLVKGSYTSADLKEKIIGLVDQHGKKVM